MSRRAREYGSALLGVAAMAIVLLLIYTIIAIRQQQLANAPLLPEIKALAERIDSCVDQTTDDGDPIGECYRQAQRNQADIVGVPKGPINTVTVLATYCQLTRGADTVPEILDCVDRQLGALAEADRSNP